MAESNDGSVIIDVELDYSKFKKDLGKVADDAQKSGKHIEEGIGKGSDNARKSIEKLAESQKQLKALYKSGAIGEKEFKVLSNQIKETSDQMKGYEKELKSSERAYDTNKVKVEEYTLQLANMDAKLDDIKRTVADGAGLSEFFPDDAEFNVQLENLLSTNKEFTKLESKANDTAQKIELYSNRMQDAENKTESFNQKAEGTTDKVKKVGDKLEEAGNKSKDSAPKLDVLTVAFGNLVAKGVEKAITALTKFISEGINYAADLEIVEDRINNTFGASGARAIDQWAENSIDKIGLASGVAKQYAASLGELASNMDVSKNKSLELSKGLTEVVGGFASIRGVDPDKIFSAIQSALTGNTKALTEYGIKLTKVDSNMSESQRTVAYYNQIMEQSGKVLDGASGEANGYHAELNKVKQIMKELGGEMAKEFLPQLTEVLSTTSEYLKENGDVLKNLGNIIATVLKVGLAFVTMISKFPPELILAVGAVIALVKGLSTASKAVDGLKSVVGLFTGDLIPLEAKIIAVSLAVGGLLYLILALKEGSDKARLSMKTMGNSMNPSNFAEAKGGYAKGTNSSEDGWFWVGEEGPELMKLRAGTQVMSATDSANFMRSGASTSYNTVASGSSYTDNRSLTLHTSSGKVLEEVESWWVSKRLDARMSGHEPIL